MKKLNESRCILRTNTGDIWQVESGHTLEEYRKLFGWDYDEGDLYDFSEKDVKDGSVEADDGRVYWKIIVDGEPRYFETNRFEEWNERECKEELGEPKEKIDEGTSNFRTPDNFPLLVFYTYDEFYYNMEHDSDYPDIDNFENEDGDIDYDAYDEAVEEFEQKYWDNNKVCVLDEDEQERLENRLYEFNEESKRIAIDADVDADGYQSYGNNLNLEDIELNIESGYYSGAYINVEHEDLFESLDEEFKKQQIERFNKFFEELKKEFHLTELGVAWGPASNGEVGYNIINDSLKKEDCHVLNLKEELKESLKESKEPKGPFEIEYWVDEEARDQGLGDMAIETFDDLEDAKEFADKLFGEVASVEVLDVKGNVVYGRYPEDESLKEGIKKPSREMIADMLKTGALDDINHVKTLSDEEFEKLVDFWVDNYNTKEDHGEIEDLKESKENKLNEETIPDEYVIYDKDTNTVLEIFGKKYYDEYSRRIKNYMKKDPNFNGKNVDIKRVKGGIYGLFDTLDAPRGNVHRDPGVESHYLETRPEYASTADKIIDYILQASHNASFRKTYYKVYNTSDASCIAFYSDSKRIYPDLRLEFKDDGSLMCDVNQYTDNYLKPYANEYKHYNSLSELVNKKGFKEYFENKAFYNYDINELLQNIDKVVNSDKQESLEKKEVCPECGKEVCECNKLQESPENAGARVTYLLDGEEIIKEQGHCALVKKGNRYIIKYAPGYYVSEIKASNDEEAINKFLGLDESIQKLAERKSKRKLRYGITTGDPAKNAAFFNHAMGSDVGDASIEASCVSLGEEEKICESQDDYYVVSDGKNPKHSYIFSEKGRDAAIGMLKDYTGNGYWEVLHYVNGNPTMIYNTKDGAIEEK